MPDEKKDGPVYPPTKQIPKVEVEGNTLAAILTEVRAMRAESGERFDKLEATVDKVETTVDTLVDDKREVRLELAGINKRIDRIEERADTSSLRVRGESEVNLKQEAVIAGVITRVGDVEKKVDEVLTKTDAQTVMLTEAKDAAKKLWANPAAKALASALWLAFVYWLGSKGIKVTP
jgi:uncharacterized coiled-coil DUF342 family protein